MGELYSDATVTFSAAENQPHDREEGAWGRGGTTSRFQEVLLSGGSKVLQQATEFLGEGPKPLRFLCFLEPSNYILQLYLILFGTLTMAVEAKDIPPLERMRPFFFSWFRFLTVPGGKGCFYIFYGIYTASMGVVCVLVHFGMRQELQQHGISVSEGSGDEVSLGRAIEPDQITSPVF